MKLYFDVNKNLKALLKQEDTDGDKKITVDDKGPKRFIIFSIDGSGFEICSTYYLSVLLQELYLAKESGKKKLQLSEENIFATPIERASSLIKNNFWDG